MSDERAGQRRSLLRPAIMIPVLAGIVILVAVFTPETTSARAGDPRLTTFSAAPQGARGVYELAGRLGWRTERQTIRGAPRLDSASIRAVLSPALPPTAIEAHAMLEDVRRGGALFVVLAGGGALEDSLPVQIGGSGGFFHSSDSAECDRPSGALALWPDWRVRLFTLSWRKGRHVEHETFVRVAPSDSAREQLPAAIGYSLGRGRVVVMSDPDLLRNDVLRVCRWSLDVVAVRALEYLRDGTTVPRRHLVFDEYHQGYGAHPGSLDAVGHYLGSTPSGRTLLQIIAAALVLVVALGVRAVPPRESGRIERRSPLEHVEALAQAYARVGATRTVALRLLHGVRRRVEPRLRGAAQSDDTLLETALARQSRLADDVAIVRRALAEPVSTHDLARAAEALDHIESSLTTPIA